ncbi:MAG: hypothetical protein ABI402_05690 [Ferruginibacter sp.]
MKKITLLSVLTIFLFFQKSNSERKAFMINKTIIHQQQDSLAWIQNLKKFKTAISLNDKNKIKSFFNFPIANPDNSIWQLIYEDNPKMKEQLSDKPAPFTEHDFDKYYNKLFPDKFFNCISKLKIDELSRKGETETIKFKQDNFTTYQMYVTIDSNERILNFALGTHKVVKNKKGEIEDNEEYGTLYIFSIRNGLLKFIGIRLTA